MRKEVKLSILSCACGLVIMGAFNVISRYMTPEEQNPGSYTPLTFQREISTEKDIDPLAGMDADFSLSETYSSNMPIIVLEVEDEFPTYKTFEDSQEVVYEDVNPWITGKMSIIDNGATNTLSDPASCESEIRIKERGHSSIAYNKKQYYFKLVDDDGEYIESNLLGMGFGNGWVLNGTMSDKSYLRNYLAYRVASEIGGNNMGLDSRYCEVVWKIGDRYQYQGLYLLIEAIERGEDRINIDEKKKDNTYTSYIVRRDRYTEFDPMLETYARLNGQSSEWIGLKYPGSKKLTENTLQYISRDFSNIERTIYSEDRSIFLTYGKKIDVDSFIDYFIINEFFGNYDAGEHSQYMFKNTGDKLHIGPVWDFDQAMNNSVQEETDPSTIALADKGFYEYLFKDKDFIRKVKKRYNELRPTILSNEHIFEIMEEAVEYTSLARVRDSARWAENYTDNTHTRLDSYYLENYELGDYDVSRFNESYEQELYVIRTYIRSHGDVIQRELTKLESSTTSDSSYRGYYSWLLLAAMIIFAVPAFLANKRG